MNISNKDKMDVARQLAPLVADLNRKIREIGSTGIDLNVYVHKDKELLGKHSVVMVDVFKSGE